MTGMETHQFSLGQLAGFVSVWCGLCAMVASQDFVNLVVMVALLALLFFLPLYGIRCCWERNIPKW